MAEAVVAPLVGKLQEMALSEAKAMVAVNGDIRRLRDRLMWMQAFLQHTDSRRRDISNELVGVWVKQTRDAAFDAEDALDHYFRRIDLSRYPTWTQSIIRFLAGLTTQLSVRHDLSRRIAEINSRLEDIIINKDTYKVETEPDKSAVLCKTSKNISTIATNLENVRPNLIPRGKLVWNLESNHRSLIYDLGKSGVGKTTLVRDMYESEITKTSFDVKVIHRSVIYVIGKSGVGKTTLVRDMYESEITKTSFDVKVWQKFPALMDSSTILQLINQQLDSLKNKTQQLDGGGILSSRKGIDKVVRRQLKEIKGKFLVVIDGELRDSDWNTILSTLLPDKSSGSRVIRIVHSKDKPQNAADDEIIQVEPFKYDAAIKLFKEMVQNKHLKDEEPTKRLPDEKDTGALDGNGEEQNIEVDGKEDDEIDNVTDGLRKLKDPDEGDKSIKQQGKQNEISEQEQSKKPWIGPWPALLNYWGNGKKRQEYIKLSEMLQVSKFLRVVKLQGIEFGENLPATIGNAVHLQYLGVTGCSLKRIPPAVGKLKHLQTLDVQDTKVDKLPQAFWNIKTLRHVLGTSIYLPKRVGNLKHLQTLAKVHPNPNHNYWDPKTFERMLRLKSLNIENSSEDAENMKVLFDAIAEPNILEYLETLVLQAIKLPMCVFTSSSQRRLRALELSGELEWDVTMLSSEKGKEETNICLPNLTTLSLEGTLVTQDFMEYLANFPLLANLTLKQNFYKDPKLVFNSGGYKCLAKMTLCDLGNLDVEIKESALPVLTDLVILQSTQTQAKHNVHGEHECLKTLQNEKN
ncbi:unnamed protein product [Urochloa decumbens]|uniref:Uncharacterized protein n=1 Tax=Urochloa decumbens TaxID=240449 RepID=A0ABC8YDW7_9POAL